MQPDDWPFVVFITCFRHRIPNLEVREGGVPFQSPPHSFQNRFLCRLFAYCVGRYPSRGMLFEEG